MEGGLYVPIFLYLIHRCMIALKYATLSNSEYRRYQTCPSGDILDEYVNQAHLATGWALKNPVVIEFEIASAAARAGVPIDKLKFNLSPHNLSSQIDKWESFIADGFGRVHQERIHGIIQYSVSVRDACISLPTTSYNACLISSTEKLLKAVTLLYMLINSLIPLIRNDLPERFNPSVDSDISRLETFWTVSYYVTSTIVTFVFSLVLLNFLATAVMSTLRIYYISESLNDMLRISDPLLLNNLRCGMKHMHKNPCEIHSTGTTNYKMDDSDVTVSKLSVVKKTQESYSNQQIHKSNSVPKMDNLSFSQTVFESF